LSQLTKYGELFPGTAVGIRFNPGIWSGQFPGVNVGWHRSSFGIWHEYIDEVKAIADRFDLRITTLHTHIGSGSDPYVWQDVAQLSLWFAKHLPDVTTVDLGWGIKVARMHDEKKADVAAIGQKISEAFVAFEKETWRQLHLEIEPGTYLLANAGYLLCTVDDIVDTWSEGEIFVKLTIGMSEIIRPIMYGARHPIRINTSTDTNTQPETIRAIVVWHSCESSDMLTVNASGVALHRELPAVSVGDTVLIGGVWAYCSSMRTVHYNSYPRIAEYLIQKNGSWKLLREAESMEAVWAWEL
jgi:diaminopimelate decarboxylase